MADQALASDFKVYNEQFQAGLWEGLTQNLDAFNGASGNALRLVPRQAVGDYEKTAIFAAMSGVVSYRDTTAVTAASIVKPTQAELVTVKVNRKIGPIDTAIDAIRKIGKTREEISFGLGRIIGQHKASDLLNTGLIAVEAALEGQTDLVLDVTGETTKTLTTDALAEGLSKMGDAAQRVVAWVMHSKPFFNLMREQISAKITNVADKVVYGANPASLGRPIIVTDAAALTDANGSLTDTYNVLGLVPDAVVVSESEQSEIVSEVVTGLENLIFRMQGEYAFNIGCKGFAWDITNGKANPTDASLGTKTYWDKVASSIKDLSGVRIVCQ